MTTDLSEPVRRTIFAALVAGQDAGASVPESRFGVAKQYGIDVDEVRRIERQGLDRGWPPL
ncbi:MAG TPA: hypothetical protein VD866_31380 [Urbifossiella sp.]|nr:hypothetical protein [Urbifossiella sp.]